MSEIITFGETMAVMVPNEMGPLRYASGFRMRTAGAESNVAIGLCKLGHSAGWLSSLGQDELGQYVLNSIRAEGVDVSQVVFDKDHRTGLMIKQLSAGETSVFYYRENSAASCFDKKNIPYEYLENARIIHLTGITPVLSQSCREAVEAISEFAIENNILLSFDPNIRKKLWNGQDYTPLMKKILFASQIALLGLDEARTILGTDNITEIIDILRDSGVRYIAIKDGANGAWCADEISVVYIPAQPCKCIDPVGAGDGFNAGFLAGILEGKSLSDCGLMGAIAGAMATETYGDIDGYPSKEQMKRKLLNYNEIYR